MRNPTGGSEKGGDGEGKARPSRCTHAASAPLAATRAPAHGTAARLTNPTP